MESNTQDRSRGSGAAMAMGLGILVVVVMLMGLGGLEAAQAPLAPPPEIETREVWRLQRDGVYLWGAAYQVSLSPQAIQVTIRVHLEPEEGVSEGELADAQRRWEQAIQAAWSNRYALTCADQVDLCPTRPITLQVQWVADGAHHSARVRAGRGRTTKVLWRTVGSEGDVAHEIGHFLGNDDEYPDRLAPNRTIDQHTSIMGNTVTGVVQARHYQPLADWLSQRTGTQYQLTPLG